MGHLSVLHDESIKVDEGMQNVLRIFASRAGTELERLRNADALRRSEELFRGYFEVGVVGMAVTSPAKGWSSAFGTSRRRLG